MTRSTISLQDLAQRIQQRQAELAKLCQEYEARQKQLQELLHRKEALQTQLRQVEAEIQGIGPGNQPPELKLEVHGTAAAVAPTKRGTKPSGHMTLGQLLVDIVGTAGGPITIKELAAEVVRRKHATTSRNIPALVADRVKDLVKKGFLRRAPNRLGVSPAQTKAKAKTQAATSNNGTPASKPKTPAVAATAKATPSAASMGALTLPAVVTKILAGSPEPIPGRELAERVLASGYQTKSKDFMKVLWVRVGQMDNVENVPGKGYRLKKGKTAAPANTDMGKSRTPSAE